MKANIVIYSQTPAVFNAEIAIASTITVSSKKCHRSRAARIPESNSPLPCIAKSVILQEREQVLWWSYLSSCTLSWQNIELFLREDRCNKVNSSNRRLTKQNHRQCCILLSVSILSSRLVQLLLSTQRPRYQGGIVPLHRNCLPKRCC